ncbi:hypothetical protein [Risungbinella massiliensis]|uniref:hypothetical protein n=1 Tax=Risungbinella massiliensis TaxID=1329796 RepID=UPI00069AA520|nr:hypothetical protein [Risungbinella massiliensis]
MTWANTDAPESVKNFLRNAIRADRVAHAYLFTGAQEAKRNIAIQFSKVLNCDQQTEDSCDHCTACRTIETGNSPEIIEVYPDGASIKIDQVRAVQKQFSFTPRPGTRRFLILHQADLLTLSAANSLLKFLEEPVSPLVAILFTQTEQSVLETIRSRCQIVRFPEANLESKISKFRQMELPDWQAQIYSNLPFDTHIMELEAFAQLIEQMIKWNQEILVGKTEALLFIYQEPFSTLIQEGQAAVLLDLLMMWQRELLRTANQTVQDRALFLPWRDNLERQAYLKDLPSLLSLMEKVMKARRDLGKPMQDQAILEKMVLAMQEG